MLHARIPAIGTIVALGAALLFGRSAPAEDAKKEGRPEIYDTKADAKARIAEAVTKASRDSKRVLVVFGGNWCGWCHKLHDLFATDREIAGILASEYEQVWVDIGSFDKALDIPAGYGADLKSHGVPFITVLGADGKALVNQDTGDLEAGPKHDPAKMKAFLEKWKAPPRDAETALEEALARAKAEEKSVLVSLGAPWCGWCRRLDAFLEANGRLFEPDWVLLKVDVDRMAKGKEVAKRLRKPDEGGIPWMAILGADGKELCTSDGPGGNIGYPVEPREIEHFTAMLRKTATRLSPEKVAEIEKALREAAAKIRGG